MKVYDGPLPYEQMYTHEIGVAARSVERIEPKARTDLLEGSRPAEAKGGQFATYFFRNRDVERWAPNAAPPPEGSSFAPDWHGVARCIGAAREIRGRATLLASDERCAWEVDDLAKVSLQVGAMPYFDNAGEPLIVRRRSHLGPAFRALFAYAARRMPEKGHGHPVRRGTNHGGYDQSPSDISAVLHAAHARYALDDLPNAWNRYLEAYADIADIYDAPREPHSTQHSRTGPIKKAQKLQVFRGGVLTHVANVVGWACRRRAVFGVPLSTNLLLHPAYDHLTAVIEGMGQWHGDEAWILGWFRRCWDRGLKSWHDDVSAFDTRPSSDDFAAFGEALVAQWPFLKPYVAIWLASENIPVMRTSVLEGERLRLYPKDGTLGSGGRWTSVFGTCANLARIITIRSRMSGRSVEDVVAAMHTGEMPNLVWGDDTQVAFPPDWGEAEAAEWNAISEEIGFPCEIGRGAVFLKRWYDVRGWSPNVGRILQQTFFNERAPRNYAVEIIGLLGRTRNAWRSPIWPLVEKAIFQSDAACLREYGISNMEQLQRAAASPRLAADLAQAVRENRWLFANDMMVDRASESTMETLMLANAMLGRLESPVFRRDPLAAVGEVQRSELLELARAVRDGDEASGRWADVLREVTEANEWQPNGT